MKNLFLIISLLLFSSGCSHEPDKTKSKDSHLTASSGVASSAIVSYVAAPSEAASSEIASSEIASSEKINREDLSDDILKKDKIIDNKQESFTNKKIQAIYFPDLEVSLDTDIFGYLRRLLIINNNYYLLLLKDRYGDDGYYLIDVEKGEIVEKGKGREKVDSILKNSIEVDDFNMSHTAIFMEGCPSFSKGRKDCEYYTDYDIGYHFSNGNSESPIRGFVMKDTTYSSIGRKKEALKIGFFSFSKSSHYPAYSDAKSIVVHNPTRISALKGESLLKAKHYESIVPADILSRIEIMWKIDGRGRYLVAFDKHPFLFMILDIDRGLDIPENHLKNIYFIKYSVLRKRFGKFRNPVLRANALSDWLNNQENKQGK